MNSHWKLLTYSTHNGGTLCLAGCPNSFCTREQALKEAFSRAKERKQVYLVTKVTDRVRWIDPAEGHVEVEEVK